MRRDSIEINGSFLKLTPKLFIITRPEYILMLCTTCGYRRSSFVIDANLDRNTRKYLTEELDQLPKCHCLEVQSDTNCNK